MWSHYADAHKRFCIEYNLRNLKINAMFLRDRANAHPQATHLKIPQADPLPSQ